MPNFTFFGGGGGGGSSRRVAAVVVAAAAALVSTVMVAADPELSPAASAIAEMHHIKAQQGEGWTVGITVQGNGFTPSFIASFLMILACEIGDKTFFIAAIMSMRHPRVVIFSGAIGALAVMTVLSVMFGWVLPLLIPAIWTHYLSIALFIYFGIQMIREGLDSDGESELEEVEV